MRVVAAVAALLLTASYLYVNADDNCVLTDAQPKATNGLNFCRKYTNNACCHPPHDLELEDALHSLLDTGDSCRVIGDIRDHPMSILYCLPCSPRQPKFVQGTTVRLCKSWVDSAFGSGDTLYTPHKLNKCGVLVSSPCVNVNEIEIPNRDRYFCGDDYIVPNKNESIENFLNTPSIGPLGLSTDDGFSIVVVESNSDDCFNAAKTVPFSTLLVVAVAAAALVCLLF